MAENSNSIKISAGNKENCPPPRLTRAATKRAASLPSSHIQPLAKRKRVALSNLPTNHSNSSPDLSTPPPLKPKLKPKRKPLAPLVPATPVNPPPQSAVVIDLTASSSSSDADSENEDPQLCAHYASDICNYLRSMEIEAKRRPLGNYIESVQKDVTANMRGILVDWLVEVAEEYRLVSDTLYLTVSYIDRFLSHNALNRQKLQLLGVASMLIAAKYEEITPPHVEDFCYITDNTYTKQEVVKMESDVLKFLNFEMGNPTIKTFLRRFIRAGCKDKNDKPLSLQLEFMGSYLAELSLLDYSLVKFLPSLIAASAVFAAKFALNPDTHPWNKKMQECTGYKVSELKDCISAIHDLQLTKRGSTLVAIREKYKQHRFKCVSMIIPRAEIPASYFEDTSD